jgi:hypothetical protein
LVLPDDKLTVVNPVITNGMPVVLRVRSVAKEQFESQKNAALLRMILLPLVSTEIKEVLSLTGL